MKIAINDLKKALTWLEGHSNDTHINMVWVDNLIIQCKDKYEQSVEIKLYEDSNMLPKIRKEEVL